MYKQLYIPQKMWSALKEKADARQISVPAYCKFILGNSLAEELENKKINASEENIIVSPPEPEKEEEF